MHLCEFIFEHDYFDFGELRIYVCSNKKNFNYKISSCLMGLGETNLIYLLKTSLQNYIWFILKDILK